MVIAERVAVDQESYQQYLWQQLSRQCLGMSPRGQTKVTEGSCVTHAHEYSLKHSLMFALRYISMQATDNIQSVLRVSKVR